MRTTVLPVELAQELLLESQGSIDELEGLTVNGHLDFKNEKRLHVLPRNLSVRKITLDGCMSLHELPEGLRCYELSARATPLTRLPEDIQVEGKLDLEGCIMLEALPHCLKVNVLDLRGCRDLRQLPREFEVFALEMTDCIHITELPASLPEVMGRLNVRGCGLLRALPSSLRRVAQLNVSDCANLTGWPESLRVTSWVDLAGVPLEAVPEMLHTAPIRWRGVMVPANIIFDADNISSTDVMSEVNTEVRRVMMERMGYEKFAQEQRTQVLNEDEDPGGRRQLLRIELTNDEPLVCLAVSCPSTGRRYMLRVPPTMRSCRQAAAWIAGYDNPNDYQPLIET